MQAVRIAPNHIPVPSFVFLTIPMAISISMPVSIPTVVFLLLFPLHPVPNQVVLFILMLVLCHIHHVLAHLVLGWLLVIVSIGRLVLVSLLGGLHHGELVALLGQTGEGFVAGGCCEHHFLVLMGRGEVAHSVAEAGETLHLVIVYHNV